jgi:hypothetical protein
MVAGAVLLVAATAGLGAAAVRIASLAAPTGLERVVAAAPIAMALAVAEALALGTIGLGGSGLALALAALLTWAAAHAWLPAPATPLMGDLVERVRSASGGERAAASALAGLSAAWVVWALRYPYLGLDGSTYHLGAVADWVIRGDTGHSLALYALIPVGSYPLTGETALAWAVGLAHSFAPVALWSASVGALLVAAGWLGLRALDVPRAIAALALAALCLVPVVVRGLVQTETDLPAVAWLVTAAALVACARRRPALLGPALVAAALAIGTKTTTLPLAALVVALGLIGAARRGELRPFAKPLALAAGLGLAVGGIWYVRNLIAHGSPLWPFVAAPWGDHVPALLGRVNYSLLERPRATLEGQWPIYRVTLSGGLVLVGGGLLAPLWARRREVLAAAAVTLVALLAWAAAPFTGAGAAPFLQVNTLRYAIPAMAAGALSLALSGRSGRARWWVGLVLLVAIGWSLKTYLDNSYLPAEGALFLATFVAAGAVFLAATLLRNRRLKPIVALPALAALIAAVVVLGGRHYAERHAQARDFNSGVTRFFTTQAAWRDGSAPIAFSPTLIGPLAGNGLKHPLELIGPSETCSQVKARARDGWVVVRGVDRKLFGTLAAERCLSGAPTLYDDGIQRVYGGG